MSSGDNNPERERDHDNSRKGQTKKTAKPSNAGTTVTCHEVATAHAPVSRALCFRALSHHPRRGPRILAC